MTGNQQTQKRIANKPLNNPSLLHQEKEQMPTVKEQKTRLVSLTRQYSSTHI
jgi:hypothetical protein